MSLIFGDPRKSRTAQRNYLDTATLRDFSGLWNASDSDLNLQSKYLPVMTNMIPDNGTGLKIRPGYKTWTTLDSVQPTTAHLSIDANTNVLQLVTDAPMWLVPGAEVQISGFNALQLGGVPAAAINGTHRAFGLNAIEEYVDGKHFYVLIGDWSTFAAEHPVPVNIQFTTAPGNIVDMVYFDNQILVFTDEGWLLGIEDNKRWAVWWSPSIDKWNNHNSQADALFDWDVGSIMARLIISQADGNPSAGDHLHLVGFPDLGGWTADEINRAHKIINADKVNNVYEIKMPRPGEEGEATAGEVFYPVNNGWHYSDLVTHDSFNRGMIFANGVDKPIKYTAGPDFSVNYLADPASGSNINVPVARFFTAGTNYAVLANGPDNEDGYVYIASTGSDNTWEGDIEPNDATFINLANIAGSAHPQIMGTAFYNDKLIAAFSDSMAVYTLGGFSEENHVPELAQVIDAFGSISHRSMVTFGENFLVCDGIGVVDVARNINDASSLRVARASEIIVKHISSALGKLPENILQRVWALHDKATGRVYMFVPDGSNYLCYVYTKWPERKIEGWSLIRGWNFSTGCRTAGNRLFTARGRTIYQIGSELEPIYTDNGAPIPFVFETPWIDFDARMHSKTSRYINIDGEGEGEFTVQMFVDRLYYDTLVNDINPPVIYAEEFDRPLTPLLSMQFTSGDAAGYGAGPQPFGGGRRANDPRLFAWVGEFKIAKFRVQGSTDKPLRFIALSLAYQRGSIR